MTCHGIVTNGTVVIDGGGGGLAEGTEVDVTPRAVADPAVDLADDLSFGLWRDRTDLPDDSVEASRVLRRRMMRRDHDDDPG